MVVQGADLRGLPDLDLDQLVEVLRRAQACFAFLHGSRVRGRARPSSDLDVGACFDDASVETWTLAVPGGVDLVALERLPLTVAGRIAVHGLVLFDDDPVARVRWQATTRLRYFDEVWRREAATRDFLTARAHG